MNKKRWDAQLSEAISKIDKDISKIIETIDELKLDIEHERSLLGAVRACLGSCSASSKQSKEILGSLSKIVNARIQLNG